MPYNSVSDLPDTLDALPAKAKEIYMKAFNSAFDQYGDEPKSHATAWAAVKRVFRKNNEGNWVARETKIESLRTKYETLQEASKQVYKDDKERIKKVLKICQAILTTPQGAEIKIDEAIRECDDCLVWIKEQEAKMNLSDENKKNLLQTALTTEYKIKPESVIPKNLKIDEVFSDRVIYDVDGQLFETTYEIGENGEAIFGNPKKVSSTRVFKPMESLQTTYSEIIQEAGRRNASLDAARVKKIVELCQELLSSEEPDTKTIDKATKEAASVLEWIKEQTAMKTEEGEKYPVEAFAYVPDSNTPANWKIRLWETPELKFTKRQVKNAAAYLSKGGFSGKHVAIASERLSETKRKIRAAYRSLDIDDDMPSWIREVETREKLYSYTPLIEAANEKGRAQVIVIKPGFNASEDRYYPAEMLKRDFGIFEGQKMYADHPTDEEDKARPERSIRDWVATLTEVKVDDDGVITGVAVIVEAWLKAKLSSLRDSEMLSEMGISINAVGSATKATIDGKETLVIERLVAARSVDFVTEPGAGGIVTMYESDKQRDIDLIELSTLRDKRPDLVKSIEAKVREETTKEVKKIMENEKELEELKGQVETLTTERDDLKAKMTEAEKAKAKAEAQAAIKEAVDKATLPGAAKERILERFKDAETADGITEAIQSEVDYIAKLAEAGKVKGMGPSKPDTEKELEALKESVKMSHPDWTDAQVETFTTGV